MKLAIEKAKRPAVPKKVTVATAAKKIELGVGKKASLPFLVLASIDS